MPKTCRKANFSHSGERKRIFKEIKHYYATGELLPPPTLIERIETVKKHLVHAIQWKGERTGILEMRRHYTNYFRGVPDIKQYRASLVTAHTYTAICDLLDEMMQKVPNE